jgi:hypothetical protein
VVPSVLPPVEERVFVSIHESLQGGYRDPLPT